MIEELVRIHRYPAIAYDEVTFTRPFDRKEAKQVWLKAIHEARELCAETLRDAPYGCFFLDDSGTPVTPTSANWESLQPHFGSIRGAWPRIVEEDWYS